MVEFKSRPPTTAVDVIPVNWALAIPTIPRRSAFDERKPMIDKSAFVKLT
jgi:hypothetical protein